MEPLRGPTPDGRPAPRALIGAGSLCHTPDEGHDFVDLGLPSWEPDVFGFLDEHLHP